MVPTVLERNFDYHPPGTDRVRQRHEIIRAEARRLASVIHDLTPSSREQALAMTKCEEAMFWANAAIARYQEEG